MVHKQRPRMPGRLRTSLAVALMAIASVACNHPPPAARPHGEGASFFEATAYTIDGTTASGTRAQEGIVAADPKVLPLGTRIRVSDAGPYSRDYVVRDTGRTIKGREIDLYIANDAEAKRFGRRQVRVEVLQYGDGRPLTTHR
jgi:3D (Asp-Asp-Asp) domain-containing protein